jgi:hypothetical protein
MAMFESKTVNGLAWRPTGPTPTASRAGWVPRVAALVAVCIIEAILILGFVVLSLGIGAGAQPGLGPDQPPPPTLPNPEPPPVLVLAPVA